jgi:hypothetical protein
MKPVRLILAALVALGLLALVLYHRSSSPGPTEVRFATPAECVDAYAEACLDGDVSGFRATLTEPLRGQSLEGVTDPGKQAEAVRLRMAEVKSWVQRGEPAIDGDEATVEVVEVHEGGARLVRFHLKRVAGGWQITQINDAGEVKMPTRYGTPATGQ